jgi:hypothetical protein
MCAFRFFYNLTDETYKARIKRFIDPEGYLISIRYYTRKKIEFALTLGRQHHELIFADSGLFTEIGLIIQKYQSKSSILSKRLVSVEKKLGHYVTPGDTPKKLRNQYRKLAGTIIREVQTREESIDPREILMQQQRIRPDRFICHEDMVMATLMGLNIEPEYIDQKPSYYTNRVKRASVFYKKTKSGKYGLFSGQPYAVATSLDYNTAYNAGHLMSKEGATHIAMGLGSSMSDRNYIDYFVKGNDVNKLSASIPRKYLRTTLIIQGFLAGYAKYQNKKPRALHFLGLGAPIMILLAAVASAKIKDVSFDATSPIKDAYEGVIYFSNPAYKNVRARKLAHLLCQKPTGKWWCHCKYCKFYTRKYPFDMSRAAKWFEDNSRPKEITADHLHGETKLAKALPMLSEPAGGAKRKEINDWRIGHNHLVIQGLIDQINSKQNFHQLLRFVADEIGKYIESASPNFANSARFSFALIRNKN